MRIFMHTKIIQVQSISLLYINYTNAQLLQNMYSYFQIKNFLQLHRLKIRKNFFLRRETLI